MGNYYSNSGYLFTLHYLTCYIKNMLCCTVSDDAACEVKNILDEELKNLQIFYVDLEKMSFFKNIYAHYLNFMLTKYCILLDQRGNDLYQVKTNVKSYKNGVLHYLKDSTYHVAHSALFLIHKERVEEFIRDMNNRISNEKEEIKKLYVDYQKFIGKGNIDIIDFNILKKAPEEAKIFDAKHMNGTFNLSSLTFEKYCIEARVDSEEIEKSICMHCDKNTKNKNCELHQEHHNILHNLIDDIKK